jgi:hypothetical protein
MLSIAEIARTQLTCEQRDELKALPNRCSKRRILGYAHFKCAHGLCTLSLACSAQFAHCVWCARGCRAQMVVI